MLCGRLVSDVLDPELTLPRAWMTSCIQTHPHCKSPDEPNKPLPTRVLDVGLQAGDTIRLFESFAGHHAPYAALSHCWGSKQTFTTSPESLEARKRSIDFDELPPTFRDAVEVSRMIGLRYLWIDSLCIIQGDMDDWRRESARMRGVYSNATVVIAASRATSDSTGFLHPRPVGERIAISYAKDEAMTACHYLQRVIQPLTPYADPLVSEPLHKRAWALQERYLATRTLFSASHLMFWECKTLISAEDGRTEERLAHRVEQLVPVISASSIASRESTRELARYRPWYSTVEKYMSCRLTYSSDRLTAIYGVAESIWQETRDVYLAGLWRGGLVSGLMWRRYRSSALQQHESYVAPSWSWASVDGEIEFCTLTWFNTFPQGIEYYAALHDQHMVFERGRFSTMKDRVLEIEAPMLPVCGWKGPFGPEHFPELLTGGAGVRLRSFGPFHRVFDKLFAVEVSGITVLVAGSLDFPQNHSNASNLFAVFLAGACPLPPELVSGPEPSNEGFFGLIVTRESGNGNAFSRVGVVHGKLMAEGHLLGDDEAFELYRSKRKQDYLCSVGKATTKPVWHTVYFTDLERRIIRLM